MGMLLASALLLAACSDEAEPIPQTPLDEPLAAPVYDAGLEPAEAAMALIPEDSTVLVVMDFDQLRLQLEQSGLTSESKARARKKFWRTAERESMLFSPGLLRSEDKRLRKKYGFTQDDVSWEARFDVPTSSLGTASEGWVLKLRDDLDLDGVRRAVEAGEGPLGGAVVDTTNSLVTLGSTTDPGASWAADPDRIALVGPTASATYVDTACVPYDVAFADGDEADLAPAPAGDLDDLDDLGFFSVSYGTELVTVRLGLARNDVFDRARLPDVLPRTDPDFALGYLDPVADPGGGRIGYRLGDPDVAERLAQQRRLPFAVCGSGSS
ncbi:MAG: hypothetical protein CMJ44_16335 [Pimelobacter sp.]|nr:hypothetical protein [Pimelobacter sp.]